ncbi:protein-lysine N-methyltransferase Efm2p [[Candida] anglica]|uniref:Protein-lysine N-methyltransferase Efm2p n=1 Tax=[Candida] anglica TaxID=148631 RepID=A0ABP0EA91_9ASCO
MDFDPLSLFTPSPSQEPTELPPPTTLKASSITNDSPKVKVCNILDSLDLPDEDHLEPIHFLDLPLLQLNPPSNVLVMFLKLLAPDQVCNFTPQNNVSNSSDPETIDPSIGLVDRGVSEDLMVKCLPWLEKNCPRFNTVKKLSYVPTLAPTLKRSHETNYNAWLTRVISLPECTDETLQLASLRMSENCGRTAQPEIIRKIIVPNLSKHGRESVSLKEPSLTADNLGLKTWGSALILATRLLNYPLVGSHDSHPLLKSPVLELGAGTGLVGIVSTLMGYQTTLTDLPEIVPNLETNVQLNKLNAQVEELDWTKPQSFVSKNGSRNFKTIILSDPIYSSQHPYWVVDMIDLFLDESDDARVLIQIPLRGKYEAERKLLWDLVEPGFEVCEEHIEEGVDDFGEMNYCFKKLKRRR